MKGLLGLPIFLLWLVLAFVAFRRSTAGSETGHPDLTLWWGVIAVLLTIAATGALIGGYLHSRYHRS